MILSGRGGFATRNEFILDAIQERLAEVLTPADDNEGAVNAALGLDETAGSGFAFTALESMNGGWVLDQDRNDDPDAGPLFGFHNRDYPSLWAASRLARATAVGPVSFEDFVSETIAQAWDFVSALSATGGGEKLAALFPKNREKRKASEGVFRSFAIGTCSLGPEHMSSTGPLFQWNLAGLRRSTGTVEVGLTSPGRRLLASLSGLTIEEPHPRKFADLFLGYIAEHAPGDWIGFWELLGAIGESGATRTSLIERFRKVGDRWTDNEVSTNAAGYVARAREWGLLEPKQVDGRYQLTEYGAAVLRSPEEILT